MALINEGLVTLTVRGGRGCPATCFPTRETTNSNFPKTNNLVPQAKPTIQDKDVLSLGIQVKPISSPKTLSRYWSESRNAKDYPDVTYSTFFPNIGYFVFMS